MDRALQSLYRATRDLHELVIRLHTQLENRFKIEIDLEELVDGIYALRETSKFLEDSRKVADKFKHTLERQTCLVWAMRADDSNIRTEYCTGTPDVKPMASIPTKKRDPVAFVALMKYLGVPEHLIGDDEDSPAVVPNWKGMSSLLAVLAKEGKPLPPGIDPESVYNDYSVTIYRRRDVDEELCKTKGVEEPVLGENDEY
jgi:hypothetical protein